MAKATESFGRILLVLTTRELMSIDRMARAAGCATRAEFVRAILRSVIDDEQKYAA